MAYQLQGRLFEACTCGAYCPCQATGEPDDGSCDAVNVWHIDSGSIEGIDVSGRTLVMLSHVQGHILQGRPVTVYVDDQVTDAQQEALLNAWTGQLGGPVAEVARLFGEIDGITRAPIQLEILDGKGWLTVGQTIDTRLKVSASVHAGARSDIASDVCTTLPGSVVYRSEAAQCQVTDTEHGYQLDLRDFPVMDGVFRFEG